MANSEGTVLLSGQKLVATAGTAEALVASTRRVKRVADRRPLLQHQAGVCGRV